MLDFLKRHPQLLLFGILTAAFSGPGQTFLVSIFIGPMRDSYHLSQSEIAGIYSMATLVSALVLPFHGRLLDRLPLTGFTLSAGILLASGCLVLSYSSSLWMVFAGFFLVRNLGQGTLGMISSTTMARAFGRQRGRALGIANIGYPLSEAVFPFLLAGWISLYGWRSGWILLSVLVLLFFSPVAFLLLRNHERHRRDLRIEDALEEKPVESSSDHDWTAGRVLRDWRYYVLQIPMLVPPAFLTAIFFHQEVFAAAKGWSMHLVSAFFIAFAATRALVSLVSGPWVDRLSARRMFPFLLLPMDAGLLGYAFGAAPYWLLFFLVMAGITMGLSMTVTGAFWAELYGTRFLGSIKGLQSSIMVFSTAVTPPLFGFFLDRGVSHKLIFCGMCIYILLAAGIAYWAAGASPGADSSLHKSGKRVLK